MSDVNVMEAHDEEVSAELIKKAQEADLVEAGRYRFQVESAEKVENMKEYFDEEGKERNPFFGANVYNLRLRLTAKRDGNGKDAPFVTLERPRTIFQKVTASEIYSFGKLSAESKLFGDMAGIVLKDTGSLPKVSATIEYFKSNAAELTLILRQAGSNAETGRSWDAKNQIKAIKALPVTA